MGDTSLGAIIIILLILIVVLVFKKLFKVSGNMMNSNNSAFRVCGAVLFIILLLKIFNVI